MTIETRNPATGKLITQYPKHSSNEVEQIIQDTHAAYLQWRTFSLAERAEKMRKVDQILRQNRDGFARVITREMGKPLFAARNEIEKCAWVCDFYADYADYYLKPQSVGTELDKSYITYQPMGIVFAIMPWNFPFWQVFRFAAPTLMAGNAVLLKHAPISTGAALVIEEIFRQAEFPEHCFRSLILDNDGAKKVIAHKKVTAVTLTGSERAGSAVGAEAARHLKKVVLELGGSDPYIVLEDANLEQAAKDIVRSRLNNCGQVCISAKRIIAVEAIKKPLMAFILNELIHYTMGDPLDYKTQLGPMAREDLRAKVHNQVQQSIEQGATLVCGGEIPEGKGFYYPPTVLDHVQPGSAAYEEEIFGPVICFIDAKDEADAIRIANDSDFGLGGAVFTQDVERGEKIAAEQIQSGTVAVNTYVSSDPRLPFGGIKQSGYGRELGAEGIRAFTNVKTILVK